ncbi:L domain-like protein [Multifurca ochricompacta]|uniref:L domain-like protein n=1 Tax=Multifurca ochricompacta TaxID=376703 RepID=A0AAD4M6Z8_9AGAM|nr:L domain-like protein [Multifurca ochricompacta]
MPENSITGTTKTNSAKEVEAANAPQRTARLALPESLHPNSGDSDGDEEEQAENSGEENEDPLADLPDETEELDLVHSRLSSLDKLRLPRFAAHLQRLCIRQNFISTLDPETFSLLTKLVELDLYDNKIRHVGDALNGLSVLIVLDLSFNLLKSIPDTLHHLTSLRTAYFVQNRISKITGLQGVGATLRSLELGGNKLRKIENLDALVNLEELWLGKNKIANLRWGLLPNLRGLKRLKILALQSNRIQKIENLEALENLEELYLSHNGVERLENLESNTKLTTLDVGSNFIPEIENLSHLRHLTELWINHNKIKTLQALEIQLASLPLQTIYLEGNPCQEAEGANYRRKIMLVLPTLTQIDAT